VAVFLASAVESVEALTIIVALVLIVGALGPALVYLIPIDVLRGVVGALLLVFGLQWLQKAVLRSAGLKEKRDESAVFERQVEALSDTPGPSGRPGPVGGARPGSHPERDPAGFLVAFKGTFLEGLEVAVIVIGLGGGDHDLPLASAAAGAAIVAVALVGLVVARHLSGVPENAMKTAVGLMLVSFGTFWAGEGMGVHWPGSDLAIPVLLGAYGVLSWALVQVLAAGSQAARRSEKEPLGA
jgi:uncharacterized membrane protein